MLELLVSNSWRPVDAWWQRAVGFGDDNDPDPSGNRDSWRGNSWIRQAHRFRHAIAEARTYQERMHVIADHAAVYYAHWIFEQASANIRSVRWAIEARILARQTNEEIARTNGCSPETIEAFESLFYNVRTRLDSSDFILNCVVGPDLEGREEGCIWKLVGYLAGPHVLDAVISRFSNPMWAHRPEGVPAVFQDAAISLMKMKAAIAALVVPVDRTTRLHLIESFVKYVEIERTTDSLGNAQDQIQENLHALLSSIPFQAVNVQDVKKMPAYDQGAVELRSDELMLAAVGLLVPGLDDLRDARFPEPNSQ